MPTTVTASGDTTDRDADILAAIVADPDRAVYLNGAYSISSLTIPVESAGAKIICSASTALNNTPAAALTEDADAAIISNAEGFSLVSESNSPITTSAGPQINAGGAYQTVLFSANNCTLRGFRLYDFSYKAWGLRGGDPVVDEIYSTSDRGVGIGPQGGQGDPGTWRAGGYGTATIGRLLMGAFPNADSLGSGPSLKFSWFDSVAIRDVTQLVSPVSTHGYSLILGENIIRVIVNKAHLPGGIAQFPDVATASQPNIGAATFDETIITYMEMNDCLIGQGAGFVSTALVFGWHRMRVRNLVMRRCCATGIQRAMFNEAYGVTVQHDDAAVDGYLLGETPGARFEAASYVDSRYFEDCRFATMLTTGPSESIAPRISNAGSNTPSLAGKIKHHNTQRYASDGSSLNYSNDAAMAAAWTAGAI